MAGVECIPSTPGPTPARGVAIQPNGAAGFVLDGWGGHHPFPIADGVPLAVTGGPYWPGWTIARNVAI